MIQVLVIGESCIDKFIYCDTNRLSPEAPVPVIIPKRIVTNFGMAGNVFENLKSLHKNSKIELLTQRKQITKTRYIDDKSNHLFIRIDEGEINIDPVSIIDNLEKYDMIIVSDYNKGFLSNDVLEHIGKSSKLSILDSKRRITKNIADSFTFIKLNELEAEENEILLKNDNLIVTLGKKGCRYKNKIYESPNPKETIDVSGAGDTFTSAFIIKYYETKSIDESINFANEMASIVVSKRGVTTIS